MPDQAIRKPYPSDVSDAQWEVLAPFIPEPSAQTACPTISRREIESAHSLRTAHRLLVETDAPRFAERENGVPLFPSVETGWHLGEGDEQLAPAGASPDGPRP